MPRWCLPLCPWFCLFCWLVFARPIAVLMQAPEEAMAYRKLHPHRGQRYFLYCGIQPDGRHLPRSGRQQIPVVVRAGGLHCQHCGRPAAGGRAQNGCCRCCGGNGAGTGCQRGVRHCNAGEERSPVYHQKVGFSPRRTVPEIPGDRSAAGLAGIFDPAFFPGALRLCQPPRPGCILRLWRCLQDR